ncbi:MAG: hypothetical protein IPN29_03760 [Saprospiraceae bacterium]|nr:hypothetical protein [Saprospiraceae bacterium]
MKKFAISMAALLFVAITSLSAKTPSFLKNEDAKSIVLHLNHWKAEKITISIMDKSGNTVFSEALNLPKTNRKYDVSGLAQGQYSVMVEDGQKFAVQHLTIEMGQIYINQETDEVYKPIFLTENAVWSVQALTLEKNAVVSIYDENDNLVFTEKIEKPVVERRYDVSNLGRGSYIVEYSVANKVFTHKVDKK